MWKIPACLMVFVLCVPAAAADYWLCVDAQGHKTAQDHACAEEAVQSQSHGTPVAESRKASAAKSPPLIDSRTVQDLALRYLPWGALLMGVIVLLRLMLRWLVQVLADWREHRAQRPSEPERIEPSDELKRQ